MKIRGIIGDDDAERLIMPPVDGWKSSVSESRARPSKNIYRDYSFISNIEYQRVTVKIHRCTVVSNKTARASYNLQLLLQISL